MGEGTSPSGHHTQVMFLLIPRQGLEVPLIAVVQWSTPKLPFTQSIYTHYRSVCGTPPHAPHWAPSCSSLFRNTHILLPSLSLTASSLPCIRLDRPCFVMTASCESPVRTYERFTVTYTLLNNLQDFLAVRLVWTPEHAQAGR